MSESVDVLELFGTDEPVAERRTLTAGLLTAILEDGNLRSISYGGVEVVRAINYLARDESWGTYKAELSDIQISGSATAFEVSYTGLCAGQQGRFSYAMTVRGDASGMLTMEATGTALTDFPTNRTGFVVLHPAEAAGGRLTIKHTDGQLEETVFPEAISPDQPAFYIAAMTHEPATGLVCIVEMEGDAFEMEDQRNWTDASFKTYIRPLSKPRPFVLAKGGTDVQRVTVTVSSAAKVVARTPVVAARLAVGEPAGRMPSMALFLDPDELPAALENATLLGPVQDVIMRFDRDRAHDARTLARGSAFAASIDGKLALEAIFGAVDPIAEAKFLASEIRSAGIEPSAILISPRREFKTRPSHTLPAGQRPISELVDALRATGTNAKIGAGTPSFFTEFNRNPPSGDADFVFFSMAGIVHAADDISVMETVSVYPSLISSARKLCPEKPLWLGPCTIGIRHNPYGPNVTANPNRLRVPGAGEDPRHAALFGASFAVGVSAQAAAAGVDRLIVASPTGRFGLLDDAGNRRPLQTVHAELAAAAGAEHYSVTSGHEGVSAVAYRLGELVRILVANVTPNDVTLSIAHDVQLVEMVDQAGILTRSPLKPKLGRYRTMMLSVAIPKG